MSFSLSKIVKLGIFLLVFLVGFSYTVDAQNRNKRSSDVDEYFDEDSFGPHRFWYGGGIGLGFNGFGGQSQFQFSISPMVGYKITPNFSVGPRAELGYQHSREEVFDPRTSQVSVVKTNFWNYGLGVFARHKILQQFFVHAEYQLESARVNNSVGGSDRGSRDNFYIGGGYTSGGGLIGYEISILYNVFDDNTLNLPIDYRIAFTYNF